MPACSVASPPQPAEPQPHSHSHNANKPLRVTLSSDWCDGTHSPLPGDADGHWSDLWSLWSDPYARVFAAMSDRDESAYRASPHYALFDQRLREGVGRLVLRDADLACEARWRTLGYFLASRNDVHALRLHGVELKVAHLSSLRQVLMSALLAGSIKRRRLRQQRQRQKQQYQYNPQSQISTDEEDSSMSSSDASTGACSDSDVDFAQEWTGGWGVDVDEVEKVRMRREFSQHHSLRTITLVQNALGTQRDEEEVKMKDGNGGMSTTDGCQSSNPSTLQSLISLLLFCELLETVNVWRNNLSDCHAIELTEKLLSSHPSLKTLSLRWNGITSRGAQEIGRILHKATAARHSLTQENDGKSDSTPPIQHVDLSFNNIDDDTVLQLYNDGFQIEELEPVTAAPSSPTAPSRSHNHNQSGKTGPSSHSPHSRLTLNLRQQMPRLNMQRFLRLTSSMHQPFSWLRGEHTHDKGAATPYHACSNAFHAAQQQSPITPHMRIRLLRQTA